MFNIAQLNETGGQAKLEITIIKGREPALSTSVSLADKNTKKLLRIKVNTTNNFGLGLSVQDYWNSTTDNVTFWSHRPDWISWVVKISYCVSMDHEMPSCIKYRGIKIQKTFLTGRMKNSCKYPSPSGLSTIFTVYYCFHYSFEKIHLFQ